MKPVKEIIADYSPSRESLIPILQDIQNEYNYLSEDCIRQVAAGLSLPVHHVYSVATFYNVFSLKPKGRIRIKVCMGTACHVRGASLILKEAERALSLKNGETSSDGSFSLESVNCLGACALGPIMVAGREYIGHLSAAEAGKILQEFKKNETDGN